MKYTVNSKPTQATIAELERQVREAATEKERRVLQALLSAMRDEVNQSRDEPRERQGIARWFQVR